MNLGRRSGASAHVQSQFASRRLLQQKTAADVSIAKKAIRRIVRASVLRLLRVRVKYTPVADRLEKGRAIVCANHVSLVDGIIVALASPTPLIFGVDTDFSRRAVVARSGLAVLAWLGFGAVVPIDGKSPYGLRSLARSLCDGSSVMLFPEGEISLDGTPAEERPGVTWLAERTGADVLWIHISGAERSRLFAKAGNELWPSINIQF